MNAPQRVPVLDQVTMQPTGETVVLGDPASVEEQLQALAAKLGVPREQLVPQYP